MLDRVSVVAWMQGLRENLGWDRVGSVQNLVHAAFRTGPPCTRVGLVTVPVTHASSLTFLVHCVMCQECRARGVSVQ